MKAFDFRFEKLLNLRKYSEREWEIKLSEIAGICTSLENQIKNLSRRKMEMFTRRFDPTAFRTTDILSADLYIRKLDLDIDKTQTHLDEKRVVYAQIHAEYVEASKKRKILDKLKDKLKLKHKKETDRQTVKLMDDLAGSRYAAGQG
jgi:flagellar FliJ protein